MHHLVLFNVFFFIVYTNGQYEGDKCIKDKLEGVCINLRDCKTAIDEYNTDDLQICSFQNSDPIVCCLDDAKSTTYSPPVATTVRIRPSSTTEYEPPEYDYVINTKTPLHDECEPILSNMTAIKTGQMAWDKCIQYQHKLVYPCERSEVLNGVKARANRCYHKSIQLIVGGEDASSNEFPHMALVGLERNSTISWVCGGTLLSERFVLTAGHCTSSKSYGTVKYIRTGVLRRTDALDPVRLYEIIDVIKHPDYESPGRDSDIALLKTDRDIRLNKFVVPACLDVGSPNNYEHAIATGWGANTELGSYNELLQKVILEKFSTSECSDLFPPGKLLRNGFNDTTQLCYGDKKEKKDTCQGDSGGPLQLYHRQIHCMYTVVGVTSYGRKCGFVGEPAIYTRVTPFVSWIESIVWP